MFSLSDPCGRAGLGTPFAFLLAFDNQDGELKARCRVYTVSGLFISAPKHTLLRTQDHHKSESVSSRIRESHCPERRQ